MIKGLFYIFGNLKEELQLHNDTDILTFSSVNKTRTGTNKDTINHIKSKINTGMFFFVVKFFKILP